MEEMEVFVQGEGLRDIVRVEVPKGGTVKDLLAALSAHGQGVMDGQPPALVFEEDGEEPLNPEHSLEDAGIGPRCHVHVHRCHKVRVAVNFNGRQESREFPPSATIRRIKKWAVGKKVFDLSDLDASEHVLQVVGSTERPDEDVHVGSLVTHPNCEVAFDLVPKVRVEG